MLKNKKFNNYWLILISLFLIMFIFKGLKPLESASFTVTKPFASFFSGAGFWFNQKLSFFLDIKEIKNENQELTNENLKLKFELTQLKEAENENEILREELDLKKRSSFEMEASLIIGQTLSKDRRVVYLDKGSQNGIKVGDPVVIAEGILVGEISKVFPNSSEAELILDKKTKINAEIQENQIKGIVQGKYGTTASMEMIPQTADLKKGQTIITSGLGEKFPRGLLIGYIDNYQVTVDQLFKTASLKLPVNFKDLRIVWVIRR